MHMGRYLQEPHLLRTTKAAVSETQLIEADMEVENALEASTRTGKVRKPHEAFHQSHAPEPICQINPEDISEAVGILYQRIKAIRRNEGAGTYLYITANFQAFAVSETRPCATDWVKTRFKELVGYYNYVRRHNLPILKPTHAGLAEDIEDHIRELRGIL